MSAHSGLWILWLSLVCSSCEMQKQQTVAIPATPPPPAKPAPLVVTQTVAQLPDPQPVPPDSIPPRPAVEYQPPPKETDTAVEVTLDPKTVKTPARTSRPAAKHTAPAAAPTATATEPAAPEPVPPPVTPPVTPPVEEQPPAPPKLSAADESAVSKDQVNAVLSDVQKMLKELAKHKQSTADQEAVKRIRSFVRVAQQAINRDDLRQGDIVAHRALALARDLTAPK